MFIDAKLISKSPWVSLEWACFWVFVISNFNLTILGSAVPNHNRIGLSSGPSADEKCDVWAREGGRRSQERAAGGGGVPEESAKVHSAWREAPKRCFVFFSFQVKFYSCFDVHLLTASHLFFRRPSRWPSRNRKDSAGQSGGRRGRRSVLLRLWVWVWWDVCWSGSQSYQKPFQWVFCLMFPFWKYTMIYIWFGSSECLCFLFLRRG